MSVNYHGINIYPERDSRLSALAKDLLRGYYTQEGETFQEAFARPAIAFCGGDNELAQAIYDDVSKGWAMYSSPILSNAPKVGEHAKAMPISCFLGYVPDTREGLVDHQKELAWLSMLGGGVGGHWSDVRAVSDKSVGAIPHIKIADSAVEGFRQGKTRKGSYAAYLDISNPDIVEFLNIRMPTGGDINRKCFNIHHAVNITDAFMDAVSEGTAWDLVCPTSGRVVNTVDARELWQQILEIRFRTGEPYLNFIDTANRSLPATQQALGLKIHGSNLCNEIHLPTGENRTAVCCLSSVNLEKYEEWRHDRNFIKRWVRFLDNVLTYFCKNAPDEMERAIYSAYRERAIGLGAMGFHSLLQSQGIAWESVMAQVLNRQIFKTIKQDALEASRELAIERGESPDMKGTGLRNSHLLAIAPNANSGLICGVSPSVEPMRSNAFTQSSRAGSHLIKNPYLDVVIRKYIPKDLEGEAAEKWVEAQWQRVILDKGSVKTLEFLDEYEKDVFKTAFELDQRWVVTHAADRQPNICQGQSINLYFPFGAQRKYVNKVHLMAYTSGLKGLYYLRTDAGFTGDQVSVKLERVALKDFKTEEDCLACQG